MRGEEPGNEAFRVRGKKVDCEDGNANTEVGEFTFRSRKRPKPISGCLGDIARSGAPGNEVFRARGKKTNRRGWKPNIDARELALRSSKKPEPISCCLGEIACQGAPGNEIFCARTRMVSAEKRISTREDSRSGAAGNSNLHLSGLDGFRAREDQETRVSSEGQKRELRGQKSKY